MISSSDTRRSRLKEQPGRSGGRVAGMATHVHLRPLHEGKHAHAREIVQKLEEHLGRRAERTETGYRFKFDDDDAERNAIHLSGALDLVAPDWHDHVSMGL
jgi:hypothetical protein